MTLDEAAENYASHLRNVVANRNIFERTKSAGDTDSALQAALEAIQDGLDDLKRAGEPVDESTKQQIIELLDAKLGFGNPKKLRRIIKEGSLQANLVITADMVALINSIQAKLGK